MITQKLDSKERVLGAAAAAAVALAALAYFAGLGPMLSARSAKAARIEYLLQAEHEAKAAAATLAELRSEAERLDADLAAVPVKLEKASQVNARLQALVERFAGAGLVIESQEQELPVQRARFATIALRFRARGTYLQCVSVLRTLAESYRDQGVESLELSGNPAEPQRQVTMTVGLVWYVEPSEPKR